MSSIALILRLESGTTADRRTIVVRDAVIAGWTARDKVAMEEHIAELEALGVARPASTPIYYRVAARRLTTDTAIEAMGADSSGEVEFVLMGTSEGMWVGVGSDHTDRKVETYGVTVSKQMCDKPIAPTAWRYEEVAGHWDALTLRSFAVTDGARALYQEGSVAAMLEPEALTRLYLGRQAHLPDGTVMFCGTLPARGGIRSADRFEFEIEDPVLKRRITHGYDVRQLPNLG